MHMNVCMSFYDQRGAVKTARLRSTQVLFQSKFKEYSSLYKASTIHIFMQSPK